MSQSELLKKVILVLENAGIEYMATGSIVSSIQGEPRATHDIDLVILLKESKVSELLSAFPPPNFYLDADAIRDTLRNGEMFNLIEVQEGDKVDFWVLTAEGFDQSRFSRRQAVPFMGLNLQVSSPEDTILAKLRWAKLSGGSAKQFGDALHVYEVQFPVLDQNYLEHWVAELRLETLWKRLCEEAVVLP
jgi:hypothetical protein